MSSIRNSLHRRTHKERSQLSNRSKLGILEKHKDYVLRARDYHSKQERIQRLRQKAADRNKDEFYFGMNRQRTRGGIHVQDRGNTALPVDFVKVLKTQDENYIRTMRAAGLKKIEKLKAQLTMLADLIAPHVADDSLGDEHDGLDEQELDVLGQAGIVKPSKRKRASKQNPRRASNHIIFVENEDEARKYASEQAPSSESRSNFVSLITEKEQSLDLGWKETGGSKKSKRFGSHTTDLAEEIQKAEASERQELAKKHRMRLLKELSARLTRDTQLRYAERELAMQRALMGNGGSVKLRGVEKVEGEDEEDEQDEDELESMKGKKSERTAAKKEQVYKPRVYRWRLERKK